MLVYWCIQEEVFISHQRNHASFVGMVLFQSIFDVFVSAVLVLTSLEKLTRIPPATRIFLCGSSFWGL